MPSGLVRIQKAGCFHFITFSCYHRLPLLTRPGAYSIFEHELERVRQHYQFVIAGYVLMPEHVHLLMGEPQVSSLATALQVLKQRSSKLLKRPREEQFWQTRYYDFNVHNEKKRIEKLRYIHRNPVQRGLVACPENWPWSSFRHYARGHEGVVEIESEWTARRRELRSVSTARSTTRNEGAPSLSQLHRDKGGNGNERSKHWDVDTWADQT